MNDLLESGRAASNMVSILEVTREMFDKTTIGLHWATAILVTIQFLIGRMTNWLPRGPLRVDVWSVHVMVGVTLTLLVAAGLLWRVARGRRLSRSDRGVRHLLAVVTHRLLDVLLLITVGLGITNVFAHAFPLFNVWHFPKVGDDEFMHSVNAWHGLVANILIAVAVFHSAAALFHHYVIRDKVLQRMLPRH